jgi:hypothetical protein
MSLFLNICLANTNVMAMKNTALMIWPAAFHTIPKFSPPVLLLTI